MTADARKRDDGKPEHAVDTLPAYALSADRLVVLLISGITFRFWPDDPADGGMANEMGRVVMQVTTCRRRRGHPRHTEMLGPYASVAQRGELAAASAFVLG